MSITWEQLAAADLTGRDVIRHGISPDTRKWRGPIESTELLGGVFSFYLRWSATSSADHKGWLRDSYVAHYIATGDNATLSGSLEGSVMITTRPDNYTFEVCAPGDNIQQPT